MKRNTISGDTYTFLIHSVILLSKHVDDIVSYNRIMNNDIIGYAENK